MLRHDAFTGGTSGRTAMDRRSRLRRRMRLVPMWTRGFGARRVRGGVACLAGQLIPRSIEAEGRTHLGKGASVCIWGRVYAERLRGRFTDDFGASMTSMPSNAPRSSQARFVASRSPRSRAYRIARNETSKSSLGFCWESVDGPRIAGLRIVDGTICPSVMGLFCAVFCPIALFSSQRGWVFPSADKPL